MPPIETLHNVLALEALDEHETPVRATQAASFGGPTLTGVELRHPFIPETCIVTVYSADGSLHVPKSVNVQGDWVKIALAVPPGGGFHGRVIVYGVQR